MTGFFLQDYNGPVDELGHADGHHCYLYQEVNHEFRARCSCNATWTYGADRTMEYMRSIYESHLKYFNRPKTMVL